MPALPSSRAWRSLHTDLVRSLTMVNGTAESCTSEYNNVIAIIDVLDVYRTLAEMARACFGRLGQLLAGDQAREATKFAAVRIMEHALWTLKTYPDDVDMQLVSACNSCVLYPCWQPLQKSLVLTCTPYVSACVPRSQWLYSFVQPNNLVGVVP